MGPWDRRPRGGGAPPIAAPRGRGVPSSESGAPRTCERDLLGGRPALLLELQRVPRVRRPGARQQVVGLLLRHLGAGASHPTARAAVWPVAWRARPRALRQGAEGDSIAGVPLAAGRRAWCGGGCGESWDAPRRRGRSAAQCGSASFGRRGRCLRRTRAHGYRAEQNAAACQSRNQGAGTQQQPRPRSLMRAPACAEGRDSRALRGRDRQRSP